jgi:hypothetical protein
VVVFKRIMAKVHKRMIPKNLQHFLNDIGIKGLKGQYGDTEISLRIRKFVWEHGQIFRQFMHDSWTAGIDDF